MLFRSPVSLLLGLLLLIAAPIRHSYAYNSAITSAGSVSGIYRPGATVTYTFTLNNAGGVEAGDDPNNDEFTESFSPALTLVSATAASGVPQVSAEDGTLKWNGVIPAYATVTITVTGTIKPNSYGARIDAQGYLLISNAYQYTPTTTFNVQSIYLQGFQDVAGTFAPGGTVTYTVGLVNTGNTTQPDNPGHEFSEVLPPEVTLLSATASSGTVVATPASNSITWDGEVAGLPPGYISIGFDNPPFALTITITARVKTDTGGKTVSALGQLKYDRDLDGTNEAANVTHRSGLIFFSDNATVFTVGSFQDIAFVTGKKATAIDALANDSALGPSHRLTAISHPGKGKATFDAQGVVHYTPTAALPRGGDHFTYSADDGQGGGAYEVEIAVHSFRDVAGVYRGLTVQPYGITRDFTKSGRLDLAITPTGVFTGLLVHGGERQILRGQFDSAGRAHFGAGSKTELSIPRASSAGAAAVLPWKLSFGFTNSLSIDQLTGELLENDGSLVAGLTIDRALIPAPASAPGSLLGPYTVAFEASGLNQIPHAQYPVGDGVGRLIVTRSGLVVLMGTLADGTPISSGTALVKSPPVLAQPGEIILNLVDSPAYSSGYGCALHALLYGKKGAIQGKVIFLDGTHTYSDLASLGMNWYRPANSAAQLYPAGWPRMGILVNLIGSKFSHLAGTNILPGLSAPSTTGNAEVRLYDYAIDPVLDIITQGNLDPQRHLTLVAPPTDLHAQLTIAPGGMISGHFTHPEDGQPATVHGVILQKQKRAFGFFLGPESSGEFIITAAPGSPGL